MFYTPRPLKKILYIEDDEGLARLMQRRMKRLEYEVDIAATGEEGIEKAKTGNYDVILVDNYLPGVSGIEVLKALALSEYDTPVIFITSSGDEKLAIEALRANAADYMIKDSGQSYLELLPSVMTAAHSRVELFKQTMQQREILRNYAEELRFSQQRLNMALEGAETGVWDWNITTGDLFWSENLIRALELPEGEKPNIKFWLNKIHPDDKPHVQKTIKDHLARKTKFYHCIFREKASASSDREWNWILARGRAQFDENNKAYRVIGTSTDFTEHKQLEEQLKQAKERAEAANITKSEFLAMMSHEIRTPMNAIIGLTDIMSRTKLDEKQTEILETIRSSSSTLLTLINDVLDISRVEAMEMKLEKQPFDFCELITNVTSILSLSASSKGLAFEVDCGELKDLHFLGDKDRIQQIITNLCSNAIKFTDQGKVTVGAKYKKLKDDMYNISIKVSDSGIGIPQDKLGVIFDKFVQADQSITRKFGGSGLGLTISHSLAKQMGGHIEVQSEEGVGSTFILALPLPLAKTTGKKTKRSAGPKPVQETVAGKPRILLVEDHPPNVLVATLLLDSMGLEYALANNGLEALEKITAAPNRFGIILMDVQMHVMDGFEATRNIRQLEKEKKWKPHFIIGLTAHALTGDREKCLAAGMNEYISKPIDVEELENKIKLLWKDAKIQ